jgi:dihydroorotate dehydrogenase
VIYRVFYKWILLRLDAERAHDLAARSLAAIARRPGATPAIRRLLGGADPTLAITAFGQTLPSPLGVAAGLDKNATWFGALGALGFGFVEVGTVTADGQPGNPRPRIRRLPGDRALVNSMGFPNAGAAAVAQRLAARGRTDPLVGVNVGKSRGAAPEDAGADYRATVRRVAAHADYLVLNVSSPNTPGLRDLQQVGVLTELIAAVRAELEIMQVDIPLLVKVAPDLADEELDAIADLALAERLDGIVAVNTTVNRAVLSDGGQAIGSSGGISGAPLKARALEVLRRLHTHTQGEIVLISVGGIETAQDAWERLLAGATLVQAYTGFVYGGPLWPRRINRGLGRLVRQSGRDRLASVIGEGRPGAAPPGV